MHLRSATLVFMFSVAALAVSGQTLAPIHEKCEIGIGKDSSKFSLRLTDVDCPDDHHCGSNFNTESMNRFTGITLGNLENDGTQLTATLAAEAGTFTCTGTVHNHQLDGDALFTPDPAFVDRMGKLGFTGFDSPKLEASAFINLTTEYTQSLEQGNIKGLTTDNLIAFRIFNIDPTYAQAFVSMGYEQPDAEKLIALKVQGVNADEVRQIRGLGYKPTLDELIQIRIFHITPDFIHHMQDRGFKNLTIAKLVQIRIFNLAE